GALGQPPPPRDALVRDVAEQERAVSPHRSFGEPQSAGDALDRRVGGDQRVQARIAGFQWGHSGHLLGDAWGGERVLDVENRSERACCQRGWPRAADTRRPSVGRRPRCVELRSAASAWSCHTPLRDRAACGTLSGMSDVLRPAPEDALRAWSDRVRANREQAERLREGDPPRDFYAPIASVFGADPRRTNEPALEVLRALARPGETWLDIGAGGGRYALPLALRAGRIIAVEPSEGMQAVLRGGMAEHG